MHLLAPSSYEELNSRAMWFKDPLARKLNQEKEVEFGFELKGDIGNIKSASPLFWGYHLPNQLASEWYYHPEKRASLINDFKSVAKLKPNYIVVHGIHLFFKPPAREHINRYLNRSSSQEYLKVLSANVEFLKKLKEIFSCPVKIENFPLCQNYSRDEAIEPITFLYTGAGRLFDLLYLQEKTGVDIMLDIEHLIVNLNLLNRQRNYQNLPKKEIKEKTQEEKELKEIFGFWLKEDYIPYADEEIKLGEAIKKIAAKSYHLTGSQQDCISGEKVASHGPIKYDDKVFRKNLRLVLAQNPEIIVLETASRKDNPCYHYLRPNETELSFYNLCKILLEEL